jgi:hypothetical protein
MKMRTTMMRMTMKKRRRRSEHSRDDNLYALFYGISVSNFESLRNHIHQPIRTLSLHRV